MDTNTFIGFIIAVLALLVTVLIGWNIYSVIDLKNIKSSVKEELDLLKEDNEKYKEQLKSYVGAIAYNATSVTSTFPQPQLFSCFIALSYANDSKDENLLSDILERCLFLIKRKPTLLDVADKYINIESVKCILIDCKDERAIEIYNYLCSIAPNSKTEEVNNISKETKPRK